MSCEPRFSGYQRALISSVKYLRLGLLLRTKAWGVGGLLCPSKIGLRGRVPTEVNKNWDESFGDRRQEIVFIGLKEEMDERSIRQQLDACLVSEEDASSDAGAVKDPFPVWFQEE